jgi:cytochrome c2
VPSRVTKSGAVRMKKAMWRLGVIAATGLWLGAAASARAADGAQLFHKYCFVCHDTAPGKNKLGPSLAGIVGRKSGGIGDYSYSPAMKNANLTWDDKTLESYLTNPRAFVPNCKMMFIGVKDPDERKTIIAYLGTLHD